VQFFRTHGKNVSSKEFTENTVRPWIDPHAGNIVEEMDAAGVDKTDIFPADCRKLFAGAVLDRCADKIYPMVLKTTFEKRI